MTNADIIETVGCPTCGAKAGESCKTKAGDTWYAFGQRGFRIHATRQDAWYADIDRRIETLTGLKAATISEPTAEETTELLDRMLAKIRARKS